MDANGAMQVQGRNTYGLGVDEILMRDTGTHYYYFTDHEGSVVAVTNAAGQVAEQYSYDAFGQPTIYGPPLAGNPRGGNPLTGTAISNRFLFTGREWVQNYGFYEYRARAYQPTLGRFMSEDPLGLQMRGVKPTAAMFPNIAAGSLPSAAFGESEDNLYRYVHNDPVNRTDPFGLTWVVDKDLQKQFDKSRAYLSQDPGMKKAFDAVAASKTNVYVHESKSLAPGGTNTSLVQSTKTGDVSVKINWNPHAAASVKGGSQSPAMVLGHEGSHGERYIRDPQGAIRDTNTPAAGFKNQEERRVILGPEATAARTLGETPRSSGDARFYPVNDPTDR